MDKRCEEGIDEVLASRIEELSDLSISELDEEKRAAIESIVKMYKLRQDDIKIRQEDDKIRQESEKSNSESKMSKIRIALDALAIVAPLVFYGAWMRKGLKFEETGTFTSVTFKGLLNKFRTTKS